METPNVLTIPVDYFGIWHFGWALGLIACAFHLWYPRTYPLLKITGFYFIARALWILEAPLLPYGDYTRAFQTTAGQGVVEFILVVTMAWTLRHKSLVKWLNVIVGGQIACVWIFHGGLFGWESFDTAFIALCLPFILDPILITAAVITILTHHGSTALTMLFVELLAIRPRLALAALPMLGYVAGFHHHGEWLDGQERLEMWKKFGSVWAASSWGDIVLGCGSGSFMWISILVQKFKAPMFLWLHNDWDQILFEQGLVGFCLAVAVFGRAVWRAYDKKKLLAGVLASGAFMLTYSPLRFFPAALLIAIILAKTETPSSFYE